VTIPRSRLLPMDKRVKERRRSVNRERGRRRMSVAVVAACVIVAACLFVWLRSSDVFAVERVTATAVEHVTAAEIAQATQDARGVNLLRLSTGEIERRLMALPYVRSAEVHRIFPDGLLVRLVEYEPAARFRGEAGESWLVSEDGRVLATSSAGGLPLVVVSDGLSLDPGDTLPMPAASALPLALVFKDERVSDTLPPLHHVVVSGVGGLTAVVEGGVELRLGDSTQLEQKLTVCAGIIDQYLRDGRPLAYVDASVPDRVVAGAE